MNVLTVWCAWTHVPACTRLNTLHVWPEPSVPESRAPEGPIISTTKILWHVVCFTNGLEGAKYDGRSRGQIQAVVKLDNFPTLSSVPAIGWVFSMWLQNLGSQWEKRPALLLSLWHLDISNAVEPIQSNCKRLPSHTVQEQACTRITRLVGCLWPCPKWPNTQENCCWLPPSDHIQSETLF